MKKWMILLPILGITLLLVAFFIYTVRVGNCYAMSTSGMSQQAISQLRQDCNLDSPKVVQFSGFLVLFIPAILMITVYGLLRPSRAEIQRSGPLAVFLILTLFEILFFLTLVLLSYPEPNNGSPSIIWVFTLFGVATYIGILGIWQWKRWGLWVVQGVAALITIYSGAGGITLIPAIVSIFNAFYLTMILRPLRNRMD